jgi:hypothetical protein
MILHLDAFLALANEDLKQPRKEHVKMVSK